jgi:WD40 repeat protein
LYSAPEATLRHKLGHRRLALQGDGQPVELAHWRLRRSTRSLAFGSDDETVRVRDALTGKAKHILDGQNRVTGRAFGPSGTNLAACGDIWNSQDL